MLQRMIPMLLLVVSQTAVAQFTNPVKFSIQSADRSVGLATPVVLSSTEILILWCERESLYVGKSTDGGATWGSRSLVSPVANALDITAIRTASGRILVVLADSAGIVRLMSDDNGLSWSVTSLIPGSGLSNISLSQTTDAKIWLFYSRLAGRNNNDIYTRSSTDNGQTWSSEATFSATSYDECYGSVVNGPGSQLQVYFSQAGLLRRSTSTDGGSTWSAPSAILSLGAIQNRPRVLRESATDFWLVFQGATATQVAGYNQTDVYYSRSTNGGVSWSAPVLVTEYSGRDGFPSADLLSGKPFVTFASGRWEDSIDKTSIWLAVAGTTLDTSLPPALLYMRVLTTEGDLAIPIQAYVVDETGVSSVKVTHTGGTNVMYDDGLHNDEAAGDHIYGANIGPFGAGVTQQPVFTLTDVSQNTLSVNGYAFRTTVVQDPGNVILSLDDRTGFGGGIAGISGHWPRTGGSDYIYLGSLWMRGEVSGTARIMDGYFESTDWERVSGSPWTIGKGISDEDCTLRLSDAAAAPANLGLSVQQRTFAWSAPTRDDFVIFRYIAVNAGTVGNLTGVQPAFWVDADMPIGDPMDDMVGYDASRKMIYTYDGENPSGTYLGIKLLGSSTVYSARAFASSSMWDKTRDPKSDAEKLALIGSAGVDVPASLARDWHMLLSGQPVTLDVGDTVKVAYGIVFGNGLTELQQNADTMETMYSGQVTSVPRTQGELSVSASYALEQNFPNPFNPTTSIGFRIAQSGEVSLKVYDLLGREVATLVNDKLEAGPHTITFNASGLASGVYAYRLVVGSSVLSRKLIVLR